MLRTYLRTGWEGGGKNGRKCKNVWVTISPQWILIIHQHSLPVFVQLKTEAAHQSDSNLTDAILEREVKNLLGASLHCCF